MLGGPDAGCHDIAKPTTCGVVQLDGLDGLDELDELEDGGPTCQTPGGIQPPLGWRIGIHTQPSQIHRTKKTFEFHCSGDILVPHQLLHSPRSGSIQAGTTEGSLPSEKHGTNRARFW